MPIYEYYCFDCRQKVALFFRTVRAAQEAAPSCPQCGGVRLRRLISRVALLQSDDARLEQILEDESLMSGLEREDPRALARFMRAMQSELGDEAIEPELDDMIDRLEAGESPDAIEASLGEEPLP